MFDPLLYKIVFGPLNMSFKHMCMQAVCVSFLLPSLPACGHESSRELPLFSLCLTPIVLICILASLEEISSLLSTLLLLVNDMLDSLCKPCSFQNHKQAHLLILLISVCSPFFCHPEDCNTDSASLLLACKHGVSAVFP